MNSSSSGEGTLFDVPDVPDDDSPEGRFRADLEQRPWFYKRFVDMCLKEAESGMVRAKRVAERMRDHGQWNNTYTAPAARWAQEVDLRLIGKFTTRATRYDRPAPAAVTCRRCDGAGKIYEAPGYDGVLPAVCGRCGGLGKVTEARAEFDRLLAAAADDVDPF